MLYDIRLAVRGLVKARGFALIALASIALGIGANTAIFSLFDQLLLQQLPVSSPNQIVALHASAGMPGRSSSDNYESVFSYPFYKDLRDGNDVFSGLIARGGTSVSVGFSGNTEHAQADMVSGNFLDVLGVQPAVGRALSQSDDVNPDGSAVVMLTYDYWVRRFGAKPSIAGEKILIDSYPFTVIGVTAPGFRGVVSGTTPDVLVPLTMKRRLTPGRDDLLERRSSWINVLGRIKPGLSPAEAQSRVARTYKLLLNAELLQLGRLGGRSRDQYLARTLELRPGAQGINSLRRDWELPMIALMAMVGLVLLIACGNIANLLLVRATARQREIAIRLAVGASRGELIRQLLTESVTLSVIGGLLGILVAFWTSHALLQLVPQDEFSGWLHGDLNSRVLLFNCALSVATGLLFGLFPAFSASKSDLVTALKDQAGTAHASGAQSRFRKAMVAVQIAISLVLLVGAGLFGRSLQNLLRLNPGFKVENLVTFSLEPEFSGYSPERIRALYSGIRERLLQLPSVSGAGAASVPILTNSNASGNITVEGYVVKNDEELNSNQLEITPGYFQTMGTPLLAGRDFGAQDAAGAPKVVIVSEEFVRRYVPDGRPLGKHMTFGGGNVKLDKEIVGVVAGMHQTNLKEATKSFVFLPVDQEENPGSMTFYVRARGNESAVLNQIRNLVREQDAGLPVFKIQSMETQVAQSIYTDRLIAFLSIAFGLLATALAALGLYGVIAFLVTRRTNEIGIRMALGATRSNVLALVMKEVGVLAAFGIVAGVVATLAAARAIQSQLFGLQANDPVILVSAVMALAVVAFAAGYIPARRAAGLDPTIALRYE